MRSFGIRLYCFAAPFAMMPVLDFSFDEVGDYLRGTEFRTVLSEFLIEALVAVADALILVIFGLTGGAM